MDSELSASSSPSRSVGGMLGAARAALHKQACKLQPVAPMDSWRSSTLAVWTQSVSTLAQNACLLRPAVWPGVGRVACGDALVHVCRPPQQTHEMGSHSTAAGALTLKTETKVAGPGHCPRLVAGGKPGWQLRVRLAAAAARGRAQHSSQLLPRSWELPPLILIPETNEKSRRPGLPS